MELDGKTPCGSNEEELASAATPVNESSLTENSNKETTSNAQPSALTLKFITWNIDGLARKYLKARTNAVCKIIKKEQPDIVLLQEVIPLTAVYIKKRLSNYHCYFANKVMEDQEDGKDNEDKKNEAGEEGKENASDEEDEESEEDFENARRVYFIGTLLKKSTVSVIQKEVIDFPVSFMSRNLLKVNVKYNDLPICLLNTHLESLKGFSKERKNQLKIVFENMLHAPEEETVIFGGDTNLEKQELIELGGLPSSIEDVWVTCGSQIRHAYTFDLYRNDNLKVNSKAAFRYDRVFVRRSSPSKLKPLSFELIGLERLTPYCCFPSDHWGILCHFERDDFKFKLDEGSSNGRNDVQVLQPY